MAWRGKAPEGRNSSPPRSRYSNMKYHIYTEYETQNLQPIHYLSPSESRSHSPLVEELLSPKFHSDSTIRNSRSFGMNTLLSSAKVSPERSTSISGRAVNVACKAVSPVTSIIHTVNTAVSPFNIIGTTDYVRSVKTRFKSKVSSCESIERPLIENISALTQPVRPIKAVRSISPAQRSIRSISPAQKSVRSVSPPISRSAAVTPSSSLKITTEPITKTINSVPKQIPSSTAKLKKMDWVSYHRLQTIHNFLDELESEFPSLCTVGTIGNSIEGRPIKVLKISNSNANNLSVWIDAGIHAREWIGPAVNTYVANHIARNFKNLPASVTEKDWYFLPVANPDGYEYTHTGDRMWRKNRAKQAGKYVGVDLNRNFSFNWGGKGSSDRATHCFYRGPEPFSEPESCAIRDMIEHSGARFLIYITLHSFGQVIIFPFASQDDLCPDYIRLLEGATVMSKAIFETNRNTYKVGLSKDVMYVASGTSNDWCYGSVGIPYCYLIELRSKKHRFKLPHEEIQESGVEILNCLLALVEFVDNRPLGERYLNNFRGTHSIETIKVAPAQEKIQVWEVKLDREGQRFLIRNLDTSGAVNIWKEEMSTMDIMVDGSRAAQVASLLHEHDIPYSIAIGDVAVLMEKEHDTSKPSKSLPQGVKMDWMKYHRLATINTFMEDLAKEFPYLCTVNVIGRTHEGRDMMMLKISNGNADNYGVWMDATIHPREWISTAVVTYIADQIARRFYSLPNSVTNKDWYILPVLNPDGYEYTHTQDRMWRKNRGRFGECIGVDLNRNWSNGWGEKGEEGSSDDPGSIFYRGPEPFSEPETDAIRRTITTSDTQFKVFLSFHSYGEVIIFPWGYTSDPCPDYVELLEAGTSMAKAIHETSGHTYKVGSTKDLMYYACGTSVDWSYGTAHIPYSYMVELRSKKHRFLLPKEDIIPTAKEVYNGVLRLMQFVDSRANTSASSSKS